jgi:hypothetical protein
MYLIMKVLNICALLLFVIVMTLTFLGADSIEGTEYGATFVDGFRLPDRESYPVAGTGEFCDRTKATRASPGQTMS